MTRALPTGTVTFLFTDIEGSTRLLQQLGASAYADALAEHRRVLREAFLRHDGVDGEVLVSNAVRDAIAESNVRIQDRGHHELKGVPGKWRLYAVERT